MVRGTDCTSSITITLSRSAAIRRIQEVFPAYSVFSSCTNVVMITGTAQVSISSSFSSSSSPPFSRITLE